MTSRRKSRLARLEEKKQKRTTFIYGLLTIALLIFIVFVGFPNAAKFSGFIGGKIREDDVIVNTDNTPPAPPFLYMSKNFTNENKIQIEGRAEAGSTVKIKNTRKATSTDVVVGSDGTFLADIILLEGENQIYSLAVDSAGNESGNSKFYTVTYDKDLPEIIILEPENEKTFYGGGERKITIKGITDIDNTVYVNDRWVVVNTGGLFSIQTELVEGENIFKIRAIDSAGNEIEEEIKVNFVK